MKQIITICTALVITISGLIPQQAKAQAPEKMSYQAVIRGTNNNLVTSAAIGMKISILQGSALGTAVYVETQTSTSNANGLVSIEIGNGTVVSGSFTAIDWSNGPYFIQTETDPAGGTNYSISGTSQLLSVPYALHAKTAETVSGGVLETDPVFGSSAASGITGTDITNWNNKLDTIPTYSLGDFVHGGIVFWLDETGRHGLVCALDDQDGGSGLTWRAGNTDYRTLSVGGGSRVYGGQMNTTQILAVSVAKGDAGNFASDCAASACRAYSGGNFGDWYLPNMYELNMIYLNRAFIESAIIAHGGTVFANARYWSSSEGHMSSAAYVGFDNVSNGTTVKSQLYRVRAIRRF